MALEYLKKAPPQPAAKDDEVRARVREIITAVEQGGEDAARRYAADLDGWTGDIVVSAETRRAAAAKIPQTLKDDAAFLLQQVREFAQKQKESMGEFQTELRPGLIAGQKHMPVGAAGCYAPGGRYAHIASAVMGVATAKTAGVEFVTACSPPRAEFGGIHPAVLYALDESGADCILNLGGAHGIAALAFGLFSGRAADVLAGPGNQFVAEAKRQLYGRCGIDMPAGPTEILIIADDTADAEIVAADLVGQAEHGPNSPALLAALSPELGRAVLELVPKFAEKLPEPNRGYALQSWRDFGEIVAAESREDAAAWSDNFAPEHLEVHCAGLDWWAARLKNYGSLFLGEETTVAYGDKISGPNHILPTRGAAKWTGGLSVAKFIKTVTWQQMTRAANQEIGATAARLSRREGMEAHARTADIRLEKWFAGQNFNLRAED